MKCGSVYAVFYNSLDLNSEAVRRIIFLAMTVGGDDDDGVDISLTSLTYCPPNISLSDITNGNISSCFIDTVINPLLLLVAAAAGNQLIK